MLHPRQKIHALDACGSLDRRNEPMEGRTQLGTFGRRHLTEIQKMPPGLDDDRSRPALLQRAVLDEKVLAPRRRSPQEWERPAALSPFSGRLASGRCDSPIGGDKEADRSQQNRCWVRMSQGMSTSLRSCRRM